jgi:hypothetical protein
MFLQNVQIEKKFNTSTLNPKPFNPPNMGTYTIDAYMYKDEHLWADCE